MQEHGHRLFKEIVVWKRIDDNTLLRYRCLLILPDNRYVVKSSDFCRWPLDKEQLSQQDYYYLDSLFQDALEEIVFTTYETLEEAIRRHDQEFS
jgi:predicted class III extradiol MEMO1 family dioxygenase